jgi:hypothetical protein
MHNLIGSLNDVKKKVPKLGTFFFFAVEPNFEIERRKAAL